MVSFTAERITKVGGGHPGPAAVTKLFARMDADKDWFPGKSYQKSRGPAPALSSQAKAAIAKSAMRMKRRGCEPTYARLVGSCSNAVLNPATKKPVDKKRVYDVMRSSCYDESPDELWTCRPRVSKTALSPDIEERRHKWAKKVFQ